MSTRTAARSTVPVLIATFLITIIGILPVTANSTPQTIPFTQDWSNTGLITVDDNWTAVPGVVGYLGNNLTSTTDTDPQTVLVGGDFVDVVANQADTSLTQGGVAEFQAGNPVVALQGTSTADAPNIVIALNTVGRSNIFVSYRLRDIDGTADDAVQPVAVQYRVGATGTFTNLPAGFVADATSGPGEASLVTPVEVGLPAAADDKSIVNVRIITTNASGNDEWVGIDDISVIAAVDDAPVVQSTTPGGGATGIRLDADLTVTFSEPVGVAAGWFTIDCNLSGHHAASASGGPTFFTLDPATDFEHSDRCTLTVRARSVTDQDAIDPPDRMGLDKAVSFITLPPDDGPVVTATNPVDGATDVPVDTNLGVTFSEPVDLAAGWYSIACGTSGAHAAGVSGGPTSFTLDPTTDFGYAETCTLTVHGAGVTDQDTNDPPDAMTGLTAVSFTTPAPPDVAPTVVATTPADGATGVAVDAVLDVTFAEPVDVVAGWQSIACGTSGAHTASVTGGPTAYSLDPDTDLAPSEACTLTIHAAQVTDQDTDDPPDAMAADTVVSFTTAAPPDDGPSVVATTPADGATDVAIDADVTVTFDEPVDVTGAWYAIGCGASGAHAATVTGGPTTYSLDLTTDLAQGESCTVTVLAGGVTDQDINDPPDAMVTTRASASRPSSRHPPATIRPRSTRHRPSMPAARTPSSKAGPSRSRRPAPIRTATRSPGPGTSTATARSKRPARRRPSPPPASSRRPPGRSGSGAPIPVALVTPTPRRSRSRGRAAAASGRPSVAGRARSSRRPERRSP